MESRIKSSKTYTNKGVHDSIEYMALLHKSLLQIMQLCIHQREYPKKYYDAIKNLYNLWCPKAMNDLNFQFEIQQLDAQLNETIKRASKNHSKRKDMEAWIENELPLKQAELIYKAIMKSMDRMSILPKEKRAIEL